MVAQRVVQVRPFAGARLIRTRGGRVVHVVGRLRCGVAVQLTGALAHATDAARVAAVQVVRRLLLLLRRRMMRAVAVLVVVATVVVGERRHVAGVVVHSTVALSVAGHRAVAAVHGATACATAEPLLSMAAVHVATVRCVAVRQRRLRRLFGAWLLGAAVAGRRSGTGARGRVRRAAGRRSAAAAGRRSIAGRGGLLIGVWRIAGGLVGGRGGHVATVALLVVFVVGG